MKKPAQKKEKMSYREFTVRAIEALRKPEYKTIHLVYSGFNQAFRDYFGEDPRPHIDQLVKEGVITLRPAKGGALIALAGDQSERNVSEPGAALAKILASPEDTPKARSSKHG